MERVAVYVELLNEGVPVWRPTTAFSLGGGLFVLSNHNHDPKDEEWSVLPGSLITIEPKQIQDGSIGVATKYNEPAQ